jgi:hypothetical protein
VFITAWKANFTVTPKSVYVPCLQYCLYEHHISNYNTAFENIIQHSPSPTAILNWFNCSMIAMRLPVLFYVSYCNIVSWLGKFTQFLSECVYTTIIEAGKKISLFRWGAVSVSKCGSSCPRWYQLLHLQPTPTVKILSYWFVWIIFTIKFILFSVLVPVSANLHSKLSK